MIGRDFHISELPDTPGVYFFRDTEGRILYIGRATSLRDRVKSYFATDLVNTRGSLLVEMVSQAAEITHQETDSVLEAILLESSLIKEHQPYFNTKEKDNRSWNYVVITDEEFPRVMLVRERALQMGSDEFLRFKIKEKFGPYTQSALIREALRIVRKIFPFRDAKAAIPHQESFYRSIGLSPKTDSPEAKREYQRTIRNLTLFFKGKKHELIRTLEREMREHAKNHEFEKAEAIKHTLYALTHIQDIALIKAEKETSGGKEGFRVEAYDIAHMSGKNKVGVMVVVSDGEIESSQYRKFRISIDKNDDVAGIKEMLVRRFAHPEWRMPDLIVIDGGVGQRNAAVETIGTQIPVVSVVKDDKHKANHMLGDETLVEAHKTEIIKANAEAHRFAIAYHKNLRKRTFLKRK